MTSLDSSSVIGHSPDVAWTGSSDRAVLMPLLDLASEPMVLTGSAADIWTRLREPLTLGELVLSLCAAYGLSEGDLGESVSDFVRQCLEIGVLSVSDRGI